MRLPILKLVLFLSILHFPLQSVLAVEVLSTRELASHCKDMPDNRDTVDGVYCARYIQGFVDGAIVTDVRVMENMEAELVRKESFTDRARRTRMPGKEDFLRAAGYAEFCLGDPLPLREIVDKVVDDVNDEKNLESNLPARKTVYASLRKHYPCEPPRN
ncbi:MAG: hypothetical protein IT495_18895 [Gammaproteobacteria bacterium]|nr:hypothetical protein [Gammaproteobacteria bacterium]